MKQCGLSVRWALSGASQVHCVIVAAVAQHQLLTARKPSACRSGLQRPQPRPSFWAGSQCVFLLHRVSNGHTRKSAMVRRACTTTVHWCRTSRATSPHWTAESVQARAAAGLPSGHPLRHRRGESLDVFRAGAWQPAAPVLVFLHGGYWRSLDKSDHSFVAPPFTRCGACVVVPNYALCPGTPSIRSRCRISPCKWSRRWPGPGATSRSTAATRRASPWRAIPPVGIWRR